MHMPTHTTRPNETLLVEDNPGDIRLTREALSDAKVSNNLMEAMNGVEALSYLRQDILRSYNLHANAYVTKPVDLEQFIKVVKAVEGFWLEIVKLPDGIDFRSA